MPARIIIKTESTMGYNNKLIQAKAGMKFGINNDVNSGTKKAALQLMDGAMAAQSPRPDLKKNDKQASEKLPIKETVSEKPQIEVSEKHEINKTAVIIGVVAVVALLFMELR